MRRHLILFFILQFALCILHWNLSAATIAFLDVGQGDSEVILGPDSRVVVIDGGDLYTGKHNKHDMGKDVVLPYLQSHGVNKIDVLIVSHAHEDHLGGLLTIIKEMPVGMVIEPGLPYTTPTYKKFLELVKEKKIPYKRGHIGQAITLGPDFKIWILHPSDPLLNGTHSDPNNNSVVALTQLYHTRILFTGDIETEGEMRMLERLRAPGVRNQVSALHDLDILKVGHHGSKTSSTAGLLDLTHPKIAVISCGRHNKYHHPFLPLIDRLKEMGTMVYRTDVDGTVEAEISSEGYKINTYPHSR